MSVDEVQQGLAQMGYRFDQPSFMAVLRTFDPDRNGEAYGKWQGTGVEEAMALPAPACSDAGRLAPLV